MPCQLRRHECRARTAVRENRRVTRRQAMTRRPLALMPRMTRVIYLRIGQLYRFDDLIEGHAVKVESIPVVRQSERLGVVGCPRVSSKSTPRDTPRSTNEAHDGPSTPALLPRRRALLHRHPPRARPGTF